MTSMAFDDDPVQFDDGHDDPLAGGATDDVDELLPASGVATDIGGVVDTGDAPELPNHAGDIWWQEQSEDGLCVPVSVAIVASQLTGAWHSEQEVKDLAVD